MGKVWSKERAWEWYNNHNWLRGCNFMSSDCANRIDQWQEEGFEERLKTADEELALAAETGPACGLSVPVSSAAHSASRCSRSCARRA